jgi:hypothetical protein
MTVGERETQSELLGAHRSEHAFGKGSNRIRAVTEMMMYLIEIVLLNFVR